MASIAEPQSSSVHDLFAQQPQSILLASLDDLVINDQANRAFIPPNSFPNLSEYLNQVGYESFVTNPIPPTKKLLCKIIRKRNIASGIFASGYPYYELYIEGTTGLQKVFFLSAIKKTTKQAKSKYWISSNRFESYDHFKNGIMGAVYSNFMGTIFRIYREQKAKKFKKELAVVTYEHNFLGFRGPRKMTLIMPSMKLCDQNDDLQSSIDLYEKYKNESLIHKQDLLVLKNKMPQWNEETQSYVLNFHGRVSQASVKNFQIVHAQHDQEYIILQFGRVGTDTFTMDIQYPMSMLMGFALAMSSFDEKRLCE